MSIGCKQHRIFVVDDEEIIATSLAMILQKSGFEATSFTHPLKALEASGSESPDLLISDVMMPELNGIDLAIRMKEICPECKVLLFSGQANTHQKLPTECYNRWDVKGSMSRVRRHLEGTDLCSSRATRRAADIVPLETRGRGGRAGEQTGWSRSRRRSQAPDGTRWPERGPRERPDSTSCAFARTLRLRGRPRPVLW